VSDPQIPPPEEIVLFEKDPATKIATITSTRPRSAPACAMPTCCTEQTSTTT